MIFRALIKVLKNEKVASQLFFLLRISRNYSLEFVASFFYHLITYFLHSWKKFVLSFRKNLKLNWNSVPCLLSSIFQLTIQPVLRSYQSNEKVNKRTHFNLLLTPSLKLISISSVENSCHPANTQTI